MTYPVAALSLSRWVFCLDFFFGFLFEYLRWDRFSPGAKCIVSGWPKNAEKLTKACPFTDSITSLDLLPDLQHLLNSTKVEKRKASSVKCLLKLSMISLQVSLSVFTIVSETAGHACLEQLPMKKKFLRQVFNIFLLYCIPTYTTHFTTGFNQFRKFLQRGDICF